MIKSERLVLKKLKVSDIDQFYLKALNDKKIMRFTESRHQKWTKKQVCDYILSHDKNNLLFGIFMSENLKHIGNIRLFNINKQHNNAELSFILFSKSDWGKGFITESVNLITFYAFNSLKLNKIYADYYAINIGSSKVFKKCKFVREGVLKKQVRVNNKYIDSIKVAKFKK